MKTKEIQTCHRCGGNGKPSKALLNTLVASKDFGDETILSRGATISRTGKPSIVYCLKCEFCGNSWIPNKTS